MIDGLQDIVGMAQFADRLRQALDLAYALGVRRHHASRFEQYLSILTDAASFSYPRPMMWAEHPDKQQLFFEAASQSQQLADAATIWPTIEPRTATMKLRTILSGTPLPPTDPAVDDGPRNILLEFAAARALQVKGFDVTLSAQAEDTLAVYGGLTFAVECKRPASPASLSTSVTKLRRQLQGRCSAGDRLGLALVGIERQLGLGGTTPNIESFAGLEAWVDRTLRAGVERVQLAMKETGTSFFPATPLGGAMLTAPVFLLDRGGIFTVSQMGLFFTGDRNAPLTKRVYDTLSRTIGTA